MYFSGLSLIIEMLEAANDSMLDRRLTKESLRGVCGACLNLNNKSNQAMTKSLDVISEAIRNPKHPFRKVDNQPRKPQKHRYERRKIREYLHLGDWLAGEAT
jgi:hypothetical protein